MKIVFICSLRGTLNSMASCPTSIMKNQKYWILLWLEMWCWNWYKEASELKWVNPVLNTIGVNSLMLGSLHMCLYLRISIISFILGRNAIVIFYSIIKQLAHLILWDETRPNKIPTQHLKYCCKTDEKIFYDNDVVMCNEQSRGTTLSKFDIYEYCQDLSMVVKNIHRRLYINMSMYNIFVCFSDWDIFNMNYTFL